jgi:hypothetical protein
MKALIYIFTFIVIVGFFTLLSYGILLVDQTQHKSDIAKEHECSYLGSARDLPEVEFYRCKEEIILKPKGHYL